MLALSVTLRWSLRGSNVGRLGLSGTRKLAGQTRDCGVILCKVAQPGVQFAVDGCVMVMKRDEMNLILWGGKCVSPFLSLSLTHTQNTLKNGPMEYALINIIQHQAVSAVSPLLHVSRAIERNLEEYYSLIYGMKKCWHNTFPVLEKNLCDKLHVCMLYQRVMDFLWIRSLEDGEGERLTFENVSIWSGALSSLVGQQCQWDDSVCLFLSLQQTLLMHG